MLKDIEIAQQAQMKPIVEIAQSVGLQETIWNTMANTRPRSPWT